MNPTPKKQKCSVCHQPGHKKPQCRERFKTGVWKKPKPEEKPLPKKSRVQRIDEQYPGLKEKLGTASDENLAQEFKLASKTIRHYRRSLGVERFGANVMPTEALDLLGSMPDNKLGERYGVSAQVVSRWRAENDVSAYKKSDAYRAQIIPLLGKRSDNSIAKDFGIHPSSVHALRSKFKIPPFCESGNPNFRQKGVHGGSDE